MRTPAEVGTADHPGHLDAWVAEATSPVTPPAESWRPWFLQLRPGELPRLAATCRRLGVALVDTIDRQLAELAAVRLPAAAEDERRRFVAEELGGRGGPEAYGGWVYLPWAARIAHLLPRHAYREVITDRNRDKITREEQARLATKRIGVVGLSVGGEAAVTVAQEHLCGAIVLAELDHLELSNLNRLGAGFDDLGSHKGVLVARRIARIDPYLEVTLFPEGVTDANLESFLRGLDLLVEECDGLRIKHQLRGRARERGLDVVFAADERGFLSVEPYSRHPELRPFHGRIEAPQPPREAYASPLAHMQALTEWMGGWERVSERSRLSLAQIGRTTSGYPQLASEARYAAGQIGHVARRLLLGERLRPFVGNLDLEEMLPHDPSTGAASRP